MKQKRISRPKIPRENTKKLVNFKDTIEECKPLLQNLKEPQGSQF
jgi:hypothetical protein